MLIRITQHFIDNPAHIDKLICIKGLPEEWIFRPSRFGGKELIPPLQPDVEANIPPSVRHLCDPVEITVSHPPIEKGRDAVVDKRTILGVRFSFMTEPGHELWEKIERYLDRMTPRDQKVPKPVLVAPNQKDGFNPHVARRTVRGSLEFEPTEIPVVDLTVHQPATEAPKSIVLDAALPSAPEPSPSVSFSCDQCPKTFDKERALRMHKLRGHKPVAVGA